MPLTTEVFHNLSMGLFSRNRRHFQNGFAVWGSIILACLVILPFAQRDFLTDEPIDSFNWEQYKNNLYMTLFGLGPLGLAIIACSAQALYQAPYLFESEGLRQFNARRDNSRLKDRSSRFRFHHHSNPPKMPSQEDPEKRAMPE